MYACKIQQKKKKRGDRALLFHLTANACARGYRNIEKDTCTCISRKQQHQLEEEKKKKKALFFSHECCSRRRKNLVPPLRFSSSSLNAGVWAARSIALPFTVGLVQLAVLQTSLRRTTIDASKHACDTRESCVICLLTFLRFFFNSICFFFCFLFFCASLKAVQLTLSDFIYINREEREEGLYSSLGYLYIDIERYRCTLRENIKLERISSRKKGRLSQLTSRMMNRVKKKKREVGPQKKAQNQKREGDPQL